jgi:hypothetical protein
MGCDWFKALIVVNQVNSINHSLDIIDDSQLL